MTERFGAVTVRQGRPPPVYDPGGPMWFAEGAGTAEDFAAAESAARAAGAVQVVVPRGNPAVLLPLGFHPMSDFWRGKAWNGAGDGDAVRATEADLPLLLDLAAARRAAYAKEQPVFWREAADARDKQEAWFRHLLAQQATALVRLLVDPGGEAFLIAGPDRGEDAADWFVDDFAVARPELWVRAGRNLLASLEGTILVVCAVHDEPKRALLADVGFVPAYTWFQKTLR